MRELLADKLAQAGLANVEMVPGPIEDSLERLAGLAPFTLTLASFSLYNVENIHRVIEALLGMTRHLVVLLGIVIACSFPTLLTSEAPNEIDFERKSVAPNGDDPMGTDEMGRDLMARVLYGGASPSGRRWPLPSARWRSRPCGQRCRPMPGGSSTR